LRNCAVVGHRADFCVRPQEIAIKLSWLCKAVSDVPHLQTEKFMPEMMPYTPNFAFNDIENELSGLHKAPFYGLGNPIIVVRVKRWTQSPNLTWAIAFLS
jgi:hypothetical protein